MAEASRVEVMIVLDMHTACSWVPVDDVGGVGDVPHCHCEGTADMAALSADIA